MSSLRVFTLEVEIDAQRLNYDTRSTERRILYKPKVYQIYVFTKYLIIQDQFSSSWKVLQRSPKVVSNISDIGLQ